MEIKAINAHGFILECTLFSGHMPEEGEEKDDTPMEIGIRFLTAS